MSHSLAIFRKSRDKFEVSLYADPKRALGLHIIRIGAPRIVLGTFDVLKF
jgi:hypothetical protein